MNFLDLPLPVYVFGLVVIGAIAVYVGIKVRGPTVHKPKDGSE